MSPQSIPFEIHLTTTDVPDSQIGLFEETCHKLGGKALLIELSQGECYKQPMMSIVTHKPTLQDSIDIAREYANACIGAGFPVTRTKIEISVGYINLLETYHYPPGSSYYEWHGKVKFENSLTLLDLCVRHGAHLSKNALKQEKAIRFITLREHTNLEAFQHRITALKNALIIEGWILEKEQSEYCVYDTNQGLDKGWLPA